MPGKANAAPMRIPGSLCVVVTAVATLIAAPVLAAGDQAASIQRGHDLVQNDCSMCHAIGPTGDSPNPLAPRFRELHKRYPIEDLAEALSEGIMVGHPQMPQFRFGSGEVADIIAYLQSIQTRQHAGLAPRHRAAG